MIDKLKKVFNKAVKEEVEMKQETKGVELPIVEAKAAADLVDLMKDSQKEGLSLEKELASLQASLLSKTDELGAALSEIQSLKTALEGFQEQKLLAEKLAKEAKLEARKQSLEMAVGTEKATSLLSSLAVLDDTAFDDVVKTMSLTIDKEKSAPGFKEIGVAGEADLSKVVPESLEMKFLKEQLAAQNKAQ